MHTAEAALARIGEHREPVVVGRRIRLSTLVANESGDRLGWAKQREQLIHEVGTEVHQHAATLQRVPVLAHAADRKGAESVLVRFIQHRHAQGARLAIGALKQRAQSEEVTIVPAILVGGAHKPLGTSELRKLEHLVNMNGHGLLDQDMLPSLKGKLSIREVRHIVRCDDHQRRPLGQCLKRGLDIRGNLDTVRQVVRGDRPLGLGGARPLHNHRKPEQVRQRGDERKVEGVRRPTVADYRHRNRLHGGQCSGRWRWRVPVRAVCEKNDATIVDCAEIAA